MEHTQSLFTWNPQSAATVAVNGQNQQQVTKDQPIMLANKYVESGNAT